MRRKGKGKFQQRTFFKIPPQDINDLRDLEENLEDNILINAYEIEEHGKRIHLGRYTLRDALQKF